jgi:hypothetical protein
MVKKLVAVVFRFALRKRRVACLGAGDPNLRHPEAGPGPRIADSELAH